MFAILGLIQHIFGKINFKAIFIGILLFIAVIVVGIVIAINKVLDLSRIETVKNFISTIEEGDREQLNEAYNNPVLKISCKDKEVLIKLFMKPRKSDIGVYAMAQKLFEEGADNKQIKEEVNYTYENLQRIECSNKYKSVIKQYLNEQSNNISNFSYKKEFSKEEIKKRNKTKETEELARQGFLDTENAKEIIRIGEKRVKKTFQENNEQSQ
ncbi:hypothetical protein [Leptotrichia hofstadii]|uniref:hypothetical protein n=1 Tax=Leptotrichia hofstadii TaxID=157688 RepID=UPI0012DCBBD9|nr:hypothetical protein [Leptotrichia hofstadii]